MTTNPTADPIADAIAALTSAARLGRTDDAANVLYMHTDAIDFGAIACHVITATAANVGGVEALLAGRPGSWEADYVRQIVNSTAGYEPYTLLNWRTEPVRLTLDLDATFENFGFYELYDQASAELARAEDEADEALFRAAATPEERGRVDEIAETLDTLVTDDDPASKQRTALWIELDAISNAVAQRADGDPGLAPLVAALAAARAAHEALDPLYEQDQAAYREAYAAAAQSELARHGVTTTVEVVNPPPLDRDPSAINDDQWTGPLVALHDHARRTAPLPMTGQPPDRTDGTPTDALRRAGLTYTARTQR